MSETTMWVLKQNENGLLCDSSEHFRGYIYIVVHELCETFCLFVCLMVLNLI